MKRLYKSDFLFAIMSMLAMVGRKEDILPVKSTATTIPKVYFLQHGTCLTSSNLE